MPSPNVTVDTPDLELGYAENAYCSIAVTVYSLPLYVNEAGTLASPDVMPPWSLCLAMVTVRESSLIAVTS